MYPAGYGFSSSEEEDFLVPCPVQGSRPVGDWVPSTLPGNPADPLSTNNNNNPRDQELELDDSDQARLLARTKKNLRAVLTAVKGELELSRLEQEYYETFEENIPWQSLSFASLGEMLEAMPRVCEVKNVMFSTYVSAVLDHNTDHIRQMVNCQKKSKKKAGKGQWRQWRPAHDYHEYNFQTEEEESWEPSATVNVDWEDTEEQENLLVNEQQVASTELEREEREERSPGLVEREDKSAVETEVLSVWLRRVRDLLTDRKFGLLLQHIELSYQREWGESLPADWAAQAETADRDLVFVKDNSWGGGWVKLQNRAAMRQ